MPDASHALTDPLPPRRPDTGFLLAHPAHLVALGFGSGLSPVAPGTCGTVWAWGAFLLLQNWLDAGQMGWLVALSLPLGWWACSVTARHLRSADPSSIVWDEVASFWTVLWVLLPAGWAAQFAAFLVFRLFDMAKPGPMGWADRRFKGTGWRGGFGIMVDDLVAAFCTLLVLALWRRLW
ncbi:phosphatidylglycerophosphatase A family protein [Ramlibacter alkalitolerans]|uniref:phosphatidylglycerophosphatase A family protein n=1 Tax=Ramlibacter alkalitolerans TaxID=2039631 RepID=UPI001F17915B|nr:phosphatidylglycerophosphatase A [Ramlibacter alkalitolerans]